MNALEELRETGRKTLYSMPIWMRLNYFCNILQEKNREDINWTKVNETIMYSNDIYDYNLYSPVNSFEELLEERNKACDAFFLTYVPFMKRTCTKCKKDFFLNKGEVDFYYKKKDEGFKLPKICPHCKHPEKFKIMPTTVDTNTIKEEVIVKTDMQIAMEKAGLI